MGRSKDNRRRFFDQHPFCCFCGGLTKATTIDHQPGRVFFRNRVWPENFVFPACLPCNEVSRTSEKALAILLHGESENPDRSPYLKNMRSFNRENPDEIARMMFRSTNDIRRVLRRHDLEKSPGTSFSRIPMVRLDATFWEPHLRMFARKLLLAIHYQCFGSPIPASGGVVASFFTNFDVMARGLPSDFLEPAKNLVFPIRNGKTLEDQFAVRYNVVNGRRAGLFVLKFHDRLLVTGITTENLKWLSQGEGMDPPFEWPVGS